MIRAPAPEAWRVARFIAATPPRHAASHANAKRSGSEFSLPTDHALRGFVDNLERRPFESRRVPVNAP